MTVRVSCLAQLLVPSASSVPHGCCHCPLTLGKATQTQADQVHGIDLGRIHYHCHFLNSPSHGPLSRKKMEASTADFLKSQSI